MPDLLLNDVPEELVRALEQRAAAHSRSTEDEHRASLIQALRQRTDRPDFWERAAKLRERTRGRILTDSADLIRQGRDER